MIDFHVNTDAIARMNGAVLGIGDFVHSADYIDGLVNAAHHDAAGEFDLAMAATAGAGYLTHVYEFGVAGITRGPVRVSDPTSPAARLWVHDLAGGSGFYEIDYLFRPAVIPNPQPTTRDTGVPSRYLRRLSKRKYVFRSKAFVMETGMEVEIKPKNGNLLFVPFYGQPSRNPMNKRGFMMYPYAPREIPIISNPGRDTQGTFTTFWETWWRSTGTSRMSRDVEKTMIYDINIALADAARRAAAERVVPAAANNLSKTLNEERMKVVSVPLKKSKQKNRRKKR